jgi:hypothetical protein
MLARVGTRMRAPGAWGSSLPRWLSARHRARPPGLDRGNDLLGRVFLDVVRGPAEDLGPVVGEDALPPPPVGSLKPGSLSPQTMRAGLSATRPSPCSTSESSWCAARISRGITCTGTRESGVGWGRLYMSRSAGVSFLRRMPPRMKTFTNTSARRTSSPPSTELPSALENSSVDRSPRIGQAQVLPITNARNHSG